MPKHVSILCAHFVTAALAALWAVRKRGCIRFAERLRQMRSPIKDMRSPAWNVRQPEACFSCWAHQKWCSCRFVCCIALQSNGWRGPGLIGNADNEQVIGELPMEMLAWVEESTLGVIFIAGDSSLSRQSQAIRDWNSIRSGQTRILASFLSQKGRNQSRRGNSLGT